MAKYKYIYIYICHQGIGACGLFTIGGASLVLCGLQHWSWQSLGGGLGFTLSFAGVPSSFSLILLRVLALQELRTTMVAEDFGMLSSGAWQRHADGQTGRRASIIVEKKNIFIYVIYIYIYIYISSIRYAIHFGSRVPLISARAPLVDTGSLVARCLRWRPLRPVSS